MPGPIVNVESPMPANARERAVRASRKLLTDAQLTTFFRAIRAEFGTPDVAFRILAVQLINEALDQGNDLDHIFFTGKKFGYQLSVKELSENAFEVTFGCQVGGTAGDGGRWKVVFDRDTVLSAEIQDLWIN